MASAALSLITSLAVFVGLYANTWALGSPFVDPAVRNVSAPTGEAKKRPPNFIFILIDDLGWADLKIYGSTFHDTPHLDRLAAQGIKFTDAYAAAPVCSPTRASVLTGIYPARLHLTDWLPGRRDMPVQKLLRPPLRQALPLDASTIAEELKPAGYVSASIGKWHLGGEGFEPTRQGFDVNVGGDNSGTPLSYFHPYENRLAKMPGLAGGREGEYLTDRLTAEAEQFIELNRKRPFFLHLSHYAVHIPLEAKAALTAKYEGQDTSDKTHSNAIYAAMLESVDESVGRVRQKLAQLQIDDDTVIIFTSDNGGLTVKEGPNTPATSNAPLREGKGYLYEGGIRVPLLVVWPGATRPGSTSRMPVTSVDFLPTMMEIAGLKTKGKTDGISLVPVLKNSGGLSRKSLYWHYPHYSNQGGRPGGAIRQGNLKLIEFYEDGRVELYDVRRDVGETTDLAAKLPQKAKLLQRELREWRRMVNAQMMTRSPDYQKNESER